VEILVANAGITRDQLLLRLSDDDIDAVLQANLVGSIRCARRGEPRHDPAQAGAHDLCRAAWWG
jgi:NAD(P)-dependent dehydrogenase (short-subunit alcohol dehydrogenase family)